MKTFFFDKNSHIDLTYDELIKDLNSRTHVVLNPYKLEIKEYFCNLILLLYLDYDFIILDNDLSNTEVISLIKQPYRIKKKSVDNSDFISESKLFEKILTSKSSFTIFTSGSSGIPKSIKHSFSGFLRNIRFGSKYENLTWGLAYNPYHIAGLNVFFQAFLNRCSIINLYKYDPQEIIELLKKFRVTNISGTPTFFRILLGAKGFFPDVKTLALGGERSDQNLISTLKDYFINAKIYNIYASTEAGSILSSSGEHFFIKEQFLDVVKIVKNELVLHKSIIGEIENIHFKDGWYYTGDIVEFSKNDQKIFKIIGRNSDFINVGGYKVNPLEVEMALNKIEGVILSKVYGQKNSVLGNILVAELKVNEKFAMVEAEIRKKLSYELQDFKIPRKYVISKKIKISRTSKLSR
jgi:acyl-CoA synthetase (AMP-forming)/AMP-acid ligase II